MDTVTLSPDHLRAAREARGLSQVQAANAVGVTRASIQNAESGRVAPRADSLARMAALYGVTIDSLFVHDAEPFTSEQSTPLNDPAPTASPAKRSAVGAR